MNDAPDADRATALAWPALERLPAYVDALRRGWSPDTLRGAAAAVEQLARIDRDPVAFVAGLVDREAKGPPVTLPDGTRAPRLPGYVRWIVDGDDAFCGSINLRWQPGSPELPPHVLGHVGYAIVPWQRARGHATRALALLLDDARAEGLPYVTLTMDEDNAASRRVVERCGGRAAGRFDRPATLGGGVALRYRIAL